MAQRLRSRFKPSGPWFDSRPCYEWTAEKKLENVDRTRLVLATGKSVIQKQVEYIPLT